MPKEELPAIHLYPGDWLRDNISGCSLEAQGLWLRMMFVMHDSDRYGYLSMDDVSMHPGFLANRCGTTLDQFTALLKELSDAGVPSFTESGVIYSRRMVRDAEKRKKLHEIRSVAGKKGGRPSVDRKQTKSKTKAKESTHEDENDKEDAFFVLPPDLEQHRGDIAAWLKYKREKGHRYKPTGLTALWAYLRKIPPSLIPGSIAQSMANNYSGIFEAKGGSIAKTQTGSSENYQPVKQPVIR